MPEIERTFLVDDPPLGAAGTAIEQGYLARDGGIEVRVRRRSGRCTLTVKSGTGIERGEVEVPIDEATFEQLWSLSRGRRIEKTRHEVALGGGLTAEVDTFEGDLAGLVLVEVEFPDRATADAFDAPDWFGREVTGEPGWSNAELATHGRPTVR